MVTLANQLLTIARNTFIESIRQPVFVVLILVGILALVMNPSLAAYTMDDDNKLLIDLGLSTIFLISLLLAAFTATGVIAQEIESKTVMTVVSKPVPRPIFILGKYLGVIGALALAYITLAGLFMLTQRHGVMQTASDRFDGPVILFGSLAIFGSLGLATLGNYLFRWVFTSVLALSLTVSMTVAVLLVLMISKQWTFQSPLAELHGEHNEMLLITLGLVLIFEAVAVLAAVAVAASTRLGQVMTLVICVGVFLVGIVSNALGQLVNTRLNLPYTTPWLTSLQLIWTSDANIGAKLTFTLSKLLHLVAPNLQFFWPADAITQGHGFTAAHIASVTAYAVCYTVAVLALAVILFQRREVG